MGGVDVAQGDGGDGMAIGMIQGVHAEGIELGDLGVFVEAITEQGYGGVGIGYGVVATGWVGGLGGPPVSDFTLQGEVFC